LTALTKFLQPRVDLTPEEVIGALFFALLLAIPLGLVYALGHGRWKKCRHWTWLCRARWQGRGHSFRWEAVGAALPSHLLPRALSLAARFATCVR
jgi:hypothetical protein